VQEQIGQNARSDGLAQNTHGHRRGRELVEQEVEDKLSPDGGYQRQSQKGQPGHICITHKGISLGQRISSQRHGADTIAQDRVGDSRDFLPNGLPDEEVAGDDPCRPKGDHIPHQPPAADLKVSGSDDDAARQGDGTAADRGGFQLAVQKDTLQRQGKERLKGNQHGGAGNGGKAQGLEPHDIVQRQKQPRRNDLSPLSSAQLPHLCPSFFPEQQEGEQGKGC